MQQTLVVTKFPMFPWVHSSRDSTVSVVALVDAHRFRKQLPSSSRSCQKANTALSIITMRTTATALEKRKVEVKQQRRKYKDFKTIPGRNGPVALTTAVLVRGVVSFPNATRNLLFFTWQRLWNHTSAIIYLRETQQTSNWTGDKVRWTTPIFILHCILSSAHGQRLLLKLALKSFQNKISKPDHHKGVYVFVSNRFHRQHHPEVCQSKLKEGLAWSTEIRYAGERKQLPVSVCACVCNETPASSSQTNLVFRELTSKNYFKCWKNYIFIKTNLHTSQKELSRCLSHLIKIFRA